MKENEGINKYDYILNYCKNMLGYFRNKKIVLFGINDSSQKIKIALNSLSLDIACYIDNSIEKIDWYNQNIEIPDIFEGFYLQYQRKAFLAADFLSNDCENCIFLILSKYEKEMRKQLIDASIDINQIYSFGGYENYSRLRENTLDEIDADKEKYAYMLAFELAKNIKKNGFRMLDVNDELEFLFENRDYRVWVYAGYTSIFNEIFIDEIYSDVEKYINRNKKYVVFDIGSNRGYASIFFSHKNWCKRIEAYELMDENMVKMKQNIKINDIPESFFGLHPYGLSDETREVDAFYFAERDGISSISTEFLDEYAPNVSLKKVKKTVMVRKTSVEIKRVMQEIVDNIIFKIDVEGAEYKILEDLVKNYPKFFDKVDIIVGDAHMGIEQIDNMLKPLGYVMDKNYLCGSSVCPFLFVKKIYCNQL